MCGKTANGFGAGPCLSHPRAVAEAITKHAPDAVLIVFETGPLATWFHRKLTADGLPAVCIDARHANAALDTAPNKTDANDADGLSLLAEAGFFREVRVKSPAAMRAEQSRQAIAEGRALIGGRSNRDKRLRRGAQLGGIGIELSNHIRGVMKTAALVVPQRRADFRDQCRHQANGTGDADRDPLALA